MIYRIYEIFPFFQQMNALRAQQIQGMKSKNQPGPSPSGGSFHPQRPGGPPHPQRPMGPNPSLAAMHRLMMEQRARGQRPPGMKPQRPPFYQNPNQPRPLMTRPPPPAAASANQPLCCPYCPYEGEDPDSLHDHILGHAPNIHWVCPYCASPSPLPKPEVSTIRGS